jgi:phage shock protein C
MTDQNGSPNPHRLYRDPDQAWLMGVCAGIAEFFGLNRGLVRFIALILLVIFSWVTLIAYGVLAFSLPKKPRRATPLSRDEAAFWREVTIHPRDSLSMLRQRFAAMERRVIALEANVTAPDFELKRQFRQL